MTTLKIIITFFISIATTIGMVGAAEFETDFDGTWRGEFQKIEPLIHSSVLPDLTEIPKFIDFAIEISEDTTRVYMVSDGVWEEVKPGSFGSVTHKTNAVVAATDSYFSENGQSGWVETWNFTLTMKDDDSLYAYWVRAVNNPHLNDGSSPDARFMMSRFGTLQRSGPVSGKDPVQLIAETPYSICGQAKSVCGNTGRRSDNTSTANQKIDQRD